MGYTAPELLITGGAEVTTTEIPASVGTYTINEATLYLRATVSGNRCFPTIYPQHLSRWHRDGIGTNCNARPNRGIRSINFFELVSFRMVAAMRAHGISSHDIKLASYLLQEKWSWEYPFSMQQIWVGLPDLFVEIDGVPVAVTRFWQSALDLMKEYLVPLESNSHGLIFDSFLQASAWSPSEGVLIDPGLQFGEPCILGTRIPTETIWALHQAGDSIGLISRMYDLPVSQINSAVKWETKLAEIAAN